MSDHDEPLIVIVDDNDAPIGKATKEEAQQAGLFHRLARVMVEDGQGRILLQRRSEDDDMYPDCWDTSSAGHVDAGEDYLQAALRELSEEIGLTNVELEEVGYFAQNSSYDWRKLNRFTTVYRTLVPSDTEFTVDLDEVSRVEWFTRPEVKAMLREDPDQFTLGAAETIERFY